MSGIVLHRSKERPGEYEACDGRYQLVKDPSDWGYSSWLIFDTLTGEDPWVVDTLRTARLDIAIWEDR